MKRMTPFDWSCVGIAATAVAAFVGPLLFLRWMCSELERMERSIFDDV